MSKRSKKIKPFFVYLEGDRVGITQKMINASTSEVLEVYQQMLGKYTKREERRKRCLNPDGTRCKKQCATCPRIQRIDLKDPCNGLPRSLEEMAENECPLPASNTFISPEDYVIRKERYQALYAAIENLESEQKQIIFSYYFESETQEQIGIELGVCQKTVSNKKKEAIEQLQELLKDFR